MDVNLVAPAWWARGLIFENCACTLVCPGHMHFSQLCTHQRCTGYWAFRFDEGVYGEVALAGVKAVVAYDSPQRMIDGGWIQSLIIDKGASEGQRRAGAHILTGLAGGPWQKLAAFVATQLAPEYRPIEIADEGAERPLMRPIVSRPGRDIPVLKTLTATVDRFLESGARPKPLDIRRTRGGWAIGVHC